uniref:hypothetical protein n=1 Tax=Erythrolobus coxiae TaxID=362235 RepID=UPI001FCE127D|nr:hypothetical protein MW556_pgp045 [Erythrolobus coxiae]UNJ17762.1 hypothetical protein [Erythrolobus coxiae]
MQFILFLLTLGMFPAYALPTVHSKQVSRNNEPALYLLDKNLETQSYLHVKKEIYFLGIKNNTLIQQIKDLFNLYELEQEISYVSNESLDKLQKKMIASNLFEKVKIIEKSLPVSKIQCIFIYLNPKVILKSIDIKDNSKSYISRPASLKLMLMPYFNSIVNLDSIRAKIQVIQDLYVKQGNCWDKVILSQINQQKLAINILQKKIGQVDIIEGMFMDYNKSFTDYKKSLNKKVPVDFLVHTLGLDLGKSLNIYQLDNRINYVKEKRILDTCRYDIDSLDHSSDLLKVSLYMSTLPNKSVYLLYKDIQLDKNIIQSMNYLLENSIFNLINHFNMHYDDNFIFLNEDTNTNYINNEILKLKQVFFPYVTRLSNDSNAEPMIFRLLNYNQWEDFFIIDSLYSGFGIRQNLRYIGDKNKSLVLDFSLPITTSCDICYQDPWFNMIGDKSAILNFSSHYSKCISNHDISEKILKFFKEKFLLSNSDQYKLKFSDSYVTKLNSILKLRHCIWPKLFLEESFSYEKFIHNYMTTSNLRTRLYANYLHGERGVAEEFIKIYKRMIDDYFKINFRIDYNNNKDTNWIKAGTSFVFDATNILISNEPSNSNSSPLINFPRFFHHLTWSQSIYLPLRYDPALEPIDFLMCDITLKHLFGDLSRFILKDDHGYKIVNYHSSELLQSYLSRYKVSLEYHRKWNKQLSAFASVLLDYIPKHDIKLTGLDYSNFKLNVGAQINIPIPRVPPLCVSYGIIDSDDLGFHIYFRPKL